MRLIYAIIALLPGIAFAQENRVPAELFGIRVGALYQLREDGSHTMPVAKVTSVQNFGGTGIHVYFEPLVNMPEFPYVEQRAEGSEHYKTSYRLDMLPVLPDDAQAREELTEVADYRVVRVEWSDIDRPAKAGSDAFFWAVSFCKSVAADLRIEPEIMNHGWYECTFVGRDLEMAVSSQFGRNISLSFRKEISEKMKDVSESRVRQMEMDRIRPYKLPD